MASKASKKSKAKSVFGEHLDEIVEKIQKAIADGHQEDVVELLQTYPKLINHRDGYGNVSLIQKTIHRSQDRLFDYLLKQPNLKLDIETLLHAVFCGKEVYVEKILGKMRERKLDSTAAVTVSLCFEPYMTPLMLACLMNNFEMVKILRKHGHTLQEPHRADCACEICSKERKGGEDLQSSEKRLATLRSLASQAYLLQDDGEDPIMDAIMLSREMEKCRALETALMDKYDAIRQNVDKIPLSLIAECSNDEQVKTVLKNPIGSSMECLISLPRLRVALDMHNKEFLADRKCQKILLTAWYGEWADWVLVPQYKNTFRILSHTLFYQFTSLIFVLTLGKYPSSCRIPFARFLSCASAHFVFLLCLLFNMQYKETRDQRGPPDIPIKQFLFAYIWLYAAGDCVVTLTDIWRLGFRRFFDVWWRYYIVVVSLMYTLNFHAFCIAWARRNENNLPKTHRAHWSSYEPTLVFEILFATSSIMSTWRMFYFMQLNRIIGPTVISIGRCVKDVMLYLIVMFAIILSFAIGLNYLYEHYKYNTVVQPDGQVDSQPTNLASITTAMRYLYWSFYGYLEPDKMAIVVGTSGPDNTETEHGIVWNAGEFLCAMYYAVLIIIILQLMVSMMTNTAAKIMEHEDLEWKYICTNLRAEYFDDSRSVAAPFCLLQLMIHATICIFRKIVNCNGGRVFSMWDMHYKDPEFSASDNAQYILIRTLTSKVLAKQELKIQYQNTEEQKDDGEGKGHETWRTRSLMKH